MEEEEVVALLLALAHFEEEGEIVLLVLHHGPQGPPPLRLRSPKASIHLPARRKPRSRPEIEPLLRTTPPKNRDPKSVLEIDGIAVQHLAFLSPDRKLKETPIAPA